MIFSKLKRIYSKFIFFISFPEIKTKKGKELSPFKTSLIKSLCSTGFEIFFILKLPSLYS